MYPLGLCSVLALAICVNRFLSLKTSNVIPTTVQATSLPLLVKEAREGDTDVSLYVIVLAVMESRPTNVEDGLVDLEAVLISEVHRLERYLTLLGTIAAISPLLGLLGTVLGMINVFFSLNDAGGAGNVSVFSGGIAQALNTTAFGLGIAIPSLICHRHFQRRVDEYTVQLEWEGKQFLKSLLSGPAGS